MTCNFFTGEISFHLNLIQDQVKFLTPKEIHLWMPSSWFTKNIKINGRRNTFYKNYIGQSGFLKHFLKPLCPGLNKAYFRWVPGPQHHKTCQKMSEEEQKSGDTEFERTIQPPVCLFRYSTITTSKSLLTSFMDLGQLLSLLSPYCLFKNAVSTQCLIVHTLSHTLRI